MLACSACKHVLPTGATSCPNCGILLTAQAVPVMQKRTPLWAWLVGVAVLFYLVCAVPEWIMAPHQEAVDNEAQAASDAAIKKKMELVDSLSTPRKFEARCGKPMRISHQNGKTTFIYRDLGSNGTGTIQVTFSKPVLTRGLDFDPNPMPRLIGVEDDGFHYDFQSNWGQANGYEALVHIGCKLPQNNATPSAAKPK